MFVKPMRLGDVVGADSVIEGADFGGTTAKTVEVTRPGFLTLVATPGLVTGGGRMFAVSKEMGMGAVDGADSVAGGAETVEVPGPGFGTLVLTGVMRRRPQALWASEDFWLLSLLGV